MLMIGLKIEAFIDIIWFQVLWPVWILLGMVLLFSLFFIVLVFLYVYSYFYEASTSSDIFSSVWIFYNLAGALFILPKLIVDLERGEIKIMCIYPLIYLSISFISVNPIKNCLVEWSRDFLDTSETGSMYEEGFEGEESLLSMSQRLANINKRRTRKLPPRNLVRVSSTFFFIGAGHRQKKYKYEETLRTHSFCVDQSYEASTHYQGLSHSFESEDRSSVLADSSAENSFLEDYCTICCERRSNSVFMECGHGGTCFDCAKSVINSSRRCILCRSTISQILKVRVKSGKECKVVGAITLD